MSEDFDELRRLLERATAADRTSENDLDPQTASLREGWIAFGRLLETAQPRMEPPLEHWKPLPLPARARRWLLPAAGLLAASLLIGIATTWLFRTTIPPSGPNPLPEQVAATKTKASAPTANEPRWDDSLDEQIAQIERKMIYVQQDQYPGADVGGVVRSEIEQVQQDVEGSQL